jgi:hypothetical protein
VRPFLQGHGGDVELLELDEAVGRSTSGCSAAATAARRRPSPSARRSSGRSPRPPEIVTIDVEEPNAPDAPGVTTAVELGRKPEVAVR